MDNPPICGGSFWQDWGFGFRHCFSFLPYFIPTFYYRINACNEIFNGFNESIHPPIDAFGLIILFGVGGLHFWKKADEIHFPEFLTYTMVLEKCSPNNQLSIFLHLPSSFL